MLPFIVAAKNLYRLKYKVVLNEKSSVYICNKKYFI